MTLQPSGYEAAAGGEDEEQNLVGHMARFRRSPLEFMREVSLHVSGTGWRAYDDPIGPPIYYAGFSENMIRNTMANPILSQRIQELARRRVDVEANMGFFGDESTATRQQRMKARGKEITKSLNEVAVSIVDNMICKMEQKFFIRGAYYLATQLLTRAYHQGIHVSSEEVLRLRAVAEEAKRKKQSIVFLPCHRSHIDYVSLQLICYRLGIVLPTVVAGDNLGIAGLKQFLQRAGAMWIRRSFAGDALYGSIVQAYIETLLKGGFHVEAFIEGGRSRTGKLLPPKFGILSYIMDAITSGRVEDAIICPVSTQYDKVIETESYISELLGQPKRKENVVDLLGASSVLSLRLGRVDVRFHEPWSLREFIQDQQTRMARSAPDKYSEEEMRVRILRTMGYRVLSDINEVSVVMPTALIGTVLLTLRGRGVGRSELVRRVDWLSERVRDKGGRVAHFHGLATDTVVERALEVLGAGLVGRIPDLAEETFYAVDRFQLSFYRNMTIHLFISEALVAVSLYAKIKQGGGSANQRMPYPDLYAQVEFLSQLFQTEFIYPTEGLTSNLGNTLGGLEKDGIITLHRDTADAPLASSTVDLSTGERAHGRENYDFYCFLLWPYVEAAWLAAVSLMALVPPQGVSSETWLDLKHAQDMSQWLGKTLYHQGDLSYYEAVNKESLKNAFERFVDDGILLVIKSTERTRPTVCQIAPDWRPLRDEQTGNIVPQGRLWDFTERIAKSRREGKNRRDGATVAQRVMALVEQIGAKLYSASTATPEEGRTLELSRAQRRKGGDPVERAKL